jgi:iron-sulfur cluster assembly protein
MLALTEDAVDAIKAIVELEEMPEGSGLRISAREGDDEDSFELGLSFAEEPDQGDDVVEERGARVFLTAEAGALLDAKVLDANVHGDHLHFDLQEQEV